MLTLSIYHLLKTRWVSYSVLFLFWGLLFKKDANSKPNLDKVFLPLWSHPAMGARASTENTQGQ